MHRPGAMNSLTLHMETCMDARLGVHDGNNDQTVTDKQIDDALAKCRALGRHWQGKQRVQTKQTWKVFSALLH